MSAPLKIPPRLGGPQADFPAPDAEAHAATVCLIDAHGRVVATDGAIAPTTLRSPPLSAAIEQVLDGLEELTIGLRFAVAGLAEAPSLARIRRLAGDEGPMALVEFSSETSRVATLRLDPLTQLADRSAVATCIDGWRTNAAPRLEPFAILFLDLNGFKQINDRFGHAAGDQVLTTLAWRWLACVREGDLVARYGGDEFVVLVKDASTAEEIEPVARRLREATEQPVDARGIEARVSVTIGIEVCESADRSIDELIAAADRDMYARKRAARP